MCCQAPDCLLFACIRQAARKPLSHGMHLSAARDRLSAAHASPAVWHWGQTAKMELVRNGRTLLRDLFEEDTGPAADAGQAAGLHARAQIAGRMHVGRWLLGAMAVFIAL